MTSPAWQEQVKGYLPLVIAGVSTVFIAVRLLIVAGFDPETAYGILQATGTVAVAVGAMISAIGPTVGFYGAYCLTKRIAPSSDNISSRRRLAAAIIGFVFSFFCSPPIIVFIYLGALFFRFSDAPNYIDFIFRVLLLILIPLSFVLAPIWIPSEQLALRDSRPVTAYVLSSTVQDVTILVDRSGKIMHIKPSDMISRTPCEKKRISKTNLSGFDRHLFIFFQIIFAPTPMSIASRYPQCPQ